MTLPTALQDREFQKFEDVGPGMTRVRTTAVGTFTPSGLNIGGKITQVTLNDSSWTPLPATALSNRNAISIQNLSGYEMKINYQEAFDGSYGYVGMVLPNGNERYYDIKDSILIYGRLATGSVSGVVNVEEIA
jgi:hypothetical protein